jgi:hypothetical protein
VKSESKGMRKHARARSGGVPPTDASMASAVFAQCVRAASRIRARLRHVRRRDAAAPFAHREHSCDFLFFTEVARGRPVNRPISQARGREVSPRPPSPRSDLPEKCPARHPARRRPRRGLPADFGTVPCNTLSQ